MEDRVEEPVKQSSHFRSCTAAVLAGAGILLFSYASASAAYEVPQVECSADEVGKAKKPFQEFLDTNPSASCQKSQNTVYDRSAALDAPDADGQDADNSSLCKSAYGFMKRAVEKYAAQVGKNCTSIKKDAATCKAKESQKDITICMGRALDNQTKREKEAVKLLEDAKSKARQYIALTSDTNKQFGADAQKIETALNQRMTQAIKAREAPSVSAPVPPDPSQATSVKQGQLSNDSFGEVIAQWGGASTISGYQQSIPQLQQEQGTATQKLQRFEQAATKEAQNRNRLADILAKQSTTTTLKAGLLGSDCRATNSCSKVDKSTITDSDATKKDVDGSGASAANDKSTNAPSSNASSGLSPSTSGQGAPSSTSRGSATPVSAPPMMSSGASSGAGSGGGYSDSMSYPSTLQTGTSPTPGNTQANGGGANSLPRSEGSVNAQTDSQPENSATNAAEKKDGSVKIGSGDAFVSGAGDLPAVSSASRAPAKGAQAASATAKGGAAATAGGAAAAAARCAPGDQACAALQDVKGGQFNNIGSLGTNIAAGGIEESSSLPSLDSLFGSSGSESNKMTDSAAMKSVMSPFDSPVDSEGNFTAGTQASADEANVAASASIFERVRLVHLRAQKRGSILQIPRKL